MAKVRDMQQDNSGTELTKQLMRIEDLLTAIVKIQFREIVENELNQSDMKKLYVLTGNYTIRDIEKKTGFSKAKISRIWQRWENWGLIIKEGKRYRKLL